MILLVVICLPLATAAAMLFPRLRPVMIRFAPWTALPALAVSVLGRPGLMIDFPWLLVGARLGLDTTAQVFLFFTSLLWLAAGLFAIGYLAHDERQHRFFVFFLAAMSGNLGLVLAQDIIGFYLFFALMSFASYGLIVHTGDPQALWAGRVYIVLVVVGETLLFSAMVLTAGDTLTLMLEDVPATIAASPMRDLMIFLFLVGFGIKLGAMPLHVWLPLAHPAAPVPASAVLSGAMIKAGLLGWLRFLPWGEAFLPAWGGLCIVAGLVAAVCGALIGVTQNSPKVLLAYSSISQMGLMSVGIGAGLMAPDESGPILAAVLVFATHHALAKASLFLGVGVTARHTRSSWQRGVIRGGLVLPALALAGALLTSGAVVKLALKATVEAVPDPWSVALRELLPLTAIGTTLLMIRFLFLTWPESKEAQGGVTLSLWVPWATLTLGVCGMPWVLDWYGWVEPEWLLMTPAILWSNVWPIAAGALLAVVVLRWKSLTSRIAPRFQVPAGDILIPLIALVENARRIRQPAVGRTWSRWSAAAAAWQEQTTLPERPPPRLLRWTARLETWLTVGILTGLLVVVLFLLLMPL